MARPEMGIPKRVSAADNSRPYDVGIDLPGMGLSSRNKFKLRKKGLEERAVEAEDWFIDALEEWRAQKAISDFTLLGHSFSAYIAFIYKLKHSHRIKKLILVSPIGLLSPVKLKQFPMFKFLWRLNLSPFAVIRWQKFIGPCAASAWTSQLVAGMDMNKARAVQSYLYQIFRLPSSAEVSLTEIFDENLQPRSQLRKYSLIAENVGMDRPIVLLGSQDLLLRNVGDLENAHIKGLPEIKVFQMLTGHSSFLSDSTDFNHILLEELLADHRDVFIKVTS